MQEVVCCIRCEFIFPLNPSSVPLWSFNTPDIITGLLYILLYNADSNKYLRGNYFASSGGGQTQAPVYYAGSSTIPSTTTKIAITKTGSSFRYVGRRCCELAALSFCVLRINKLVCHIEISSWLVRPIYRMSNRCS